MSGRKPMGPKLVHHLSGSDFAKDRLEVILETIAGNLSIAEACERIGIGEAMFHRLRARVLQAGLSDLEPRSPGRPRRKLSPADQACKKLAAQVDALEDELKISEVRQELALILPSHNHTIEPEEASAPKKTTSRARKQRRKRLRKKMSARR